MTERCSKLAQTIGVEHLTYKIPWSNPPFPPRPLPGNVFENIARTARYDGLFQLMKRSNTDVIAFGHHSDDQIETSLMRLGRGTTELGAGGMRPRRRWGMGMGKGEGFGWTGYEGMNKWIVRPLLDVSKDRILATCDVNNLEYITDTTNFQPDITLRNALRQIINGNPITEPMPTDIVTKLSAIDRTLSSYRFLSVKLESGVEQLRGALSLLTEQAAGIDSKVDSALKRCTLPSPAGTFLLSSNGIASVNDDLTRRAMINRVLRYVSFHPWGSPRADANRRNSSIQQIIHKVWNPDPFLANIRTFAAGGGVLWTPVTFEGGHIRLPNRVLEAGIGRHEAFGWLASRQPPLSQTKMDARRLPDPLTVDVTQLLAKALEERRDGAHPVVQVLYDCRFLVHFNLGKIPRDLVRWLMRNEGKIMIYPNTRWYWPKIVEERGGTTKVLHSKISDPNEIPFESKSIEDSMMYWAPKKPDVSEWIDIEWIRSLSAL